VITLTLSAQFPDSELEPFLRAIRAWEGGRETVLLAITAHTSGLSPDVVQAILARLDPPLPIEFVPDPPDS